MWQSFVCAIERDGTVKLADLGIATAAERTHITHSGIILGTAAYLAPERLDGNAGGPPANMYATAAVCVRDAERAQGRDREQRRRDRAARDGGARAGPVRGASGRTESGRRRAEARAREGPARAPRSPPGGSCASCRPRMQMKRVRLLRSRFRRGEGGAAGSPRPRSGQPPGSRSRLLSSRAVPPTSPGHSTRPGSPRRRKRRPSPQQLRAGRPNRRNRQPARPPGPPSQRQPPSPASTPALRTTTSRAPGRWAPTTCTASSGASPRSGSTLATLQSITFPTLRVTSQTGTSATVEFSSVAKHPDRTDHCSGQASLVKQGSNWLLDHIDVRC